MAKLCLRLFPREQDYASAVIAQIFQGRKTEVVSPLVAPISKEKDTRGDTLN